MSSRDPLHYGWWLASRSAGVAAYLALSAAVVLGLAMAARVAPVRHRAAVRHAHERVALIALGAVAAHGLLLLPDPWLKPGLAGVLVPFASPYRPVWTGLGVCAAYLAAGLSLSYYARRAIGPRRWRNAHRLIPVAWLLASVHVIGAGTDSHSAWLAVPLVVTIGAVVALGGYRALDRRPRTGRARVTA